MVGLLDLVDVGTFVGNKFVSLLLHTSRHSSVANLLGAMNSASRFLFTTKVQPRLPGKKCYLSPHVYVCAWDSFQLTPNAPVLLSWYVTRSWVVCVCVCVCVRACVRACVHARARIYVVWICSGS